MCRARLVACVLVAASAAAFALYVRVEATWFVLGWVGFVPWLAVLDRTASLRDALVAGVLMCVAFVLAVFGWFGLAIQTYTGAPGPLAYFVLVLVAPLLEPQLVVFALARHLVRQRGGPGWRSIAVGGFAYVGTEWACPKLFADTLGHGFYASAWMRQAADVAGAHGLTFALLVANECVWAATRDVIRRAGLRPVLASAGCAVGIGLALLAYGGIRYRQIDRAARSAAPVTAAVVQADIGQYGRLAAERGTFEAVRMILDAHFVLSSEALGRGNIDLLVWPETVYPTTFGSPKSGPGAEFDQEIGAFVARAGVPLVFGAYDVEGGDEFNAAVFLEPSSRGPVTFETYRKASLFPLTERVPAVLDSGLIRGWFPWLGTWKPGAGPEVIRLSLPGGRTLPVAPLICYDAVDPRFALAAVRGGAELIVTLSNDSWFAAGLGPRHHLVVAAFRSLETRRPQVRATNTGISAVIAPTGDFLALAGVHERRTLVATVTPGGVATLMLAWGDWFGPFALVVGTGLLIPAVRPRRGIDPGLAARRLTVL